MTSMTSMAEFHHKLNQSISLSEKQARWQAYRKQITDQIEQDIKPGGTTLILGAGACNDLDLSRLKALSDHVVLSDIDTRTTKEGVIYQGYDVLEFTYIEADYSGLESLGFFADLEALVLKQSSVHQIVDHINKSFKKVAETKGLWEENALSMLCGMPINSLIVMPRYTQLVLPPFRAILNNRVVVDYYQEEDIVHMTQAFLDKAGIVIKRFNELVRHLTIQHNAQFILLADILEYQTEDPIFSQLSNDTMNHLFLETLVNDYINQFGHGFGSYGVWHLESIMPLEPKKWFVWPYELHRKMVVAYLTGIARL
ncbi:MAG: hypothetical protein PF505_00825 [Vallitaleaceae bacterium]|jgi:hypothetical protein|nr:hypothetical protein [Vallitaleaceae bacterium]